MSEHFVKDKVDFGFSKVPNGLWTADLTHGAKCLLGWLWSHDDEYLTKLSVRRIGVEFGGGGQVVEWLRLLEAKGYVVKSKQNDRFVVRLVGGPWKALTVRKRPTATETEHPRSETERDRDGNRTVGATETEHIEDQCLEDQLRTSSVPSSLSATREVVDGDFERWWLLYPRKVNGKGQAREKWRKMLAKERVAAFAGVERHVAWWTEHETDAAFIPAGGVWLNQRRWEDDEPRAKLTAVPTETGVMARVKQRRALAAQQTKTETEAK